MSTHINTSSTTAVRPADHAEFQKLVDRTYRQAYNMAYRLTGNRDDAEDLTQEAYLRAYRSFGTYNRQLPFESWFFRILSNLFIDLLRRRPKQKPLSLDQPVGDEESDDNLLLQIPDEATNPERNLMEQVMDERLQKALQALPEPFRIAVLLCDVEGYSYEEIARIMNSSIGTVRSRIHRGRSLLRRALNKVPSAQKAEDPGFKERLATLPQLQPNTA
ncbi:MAG: sigma-70 family RNA polymerase sigma factor [Chloroherpetonaceae bacterium]|nr:sigma-70 family RNA polymerase sigma factor [Chthonomonadaceae bacterium]MDW8206340.1 sigma-70 family RNA polymerase sigma factor [Chloroherpetonaceae bacterium]